MKVITPISIPTTQPVVTRASKATYMDHNGNFTMAIDNQTRFTYVKDTSGVYRYQGLMVEPLRTNYFLNSVTGLSGLGADALITPLSFGASTRTITQATISGASGVAFTVSFYGAGKLTISGNGYSKVIQGTGATDRVWYTVEVDIDHGTYTFTPDLTSGSIYAFQFEIITISDLPTSEVIPFSGFYETNCSPTSWIPTEGAVAVRQPEIISGSGIIYNDFTETTTEYSDVTTYVVGDLVLYSDVIYQSAIGSNLNNTPGTLDEFGNVDESKWLIKQVSNSYALFDLTRGAKSIATGEAQISICLKDLSPASLDALSAIELVADNVEIVITAVNRAGVSVAYDSLSNASRNLTITSANLPVDDSNGFVINGSTSGTTYVISLYIYNNVLTDEISIGELITGLTHSAGQTQYGMQAGIVDYSVKETDTWGNTNLVIRGFSKKLTSTVYVPKSDINTVARTLYNLRAQPTVWIATDDEELSEISTIFGYMKDFTPVVNYPTYVACSLEIEGLVI